MYLAAGLQPGLCDRFEDDLNRLAIGFEVWCEAAFVADPGRLTAAFQDAAERMKDLDADAQRLAERRGADGHDHELLEINARIGVCAAVQDVHHRNGKREPSVAVKLPDVPVERDAAGGGIRSCGRHRHGE